jgi:SAM-dependent methyltransferase
MFNERIVEIPWCLSRIHGPTLDIGAAESEYLDRLPTGSVGIDIRPAAVATTLPYVIANAVALPFPDQSFDHVLCLSTFEHLGRAHEAYGTTDEVGIPEQVFAEMRRVVKKGGTLLITVPYGKQQDLGWLVTYDAQLLQETFGTPDEVTYYALPSWSEVDPATLTNNVYHSHEGRASAIACLSFIL